MVEKAQTGFPSFRSPPTHQLHASKNNNRCAITGLRHPAQIPACGLTRKGTKQSQEHDTHAFNKRALTVAGRLSAAEGKS